MSFNEHEEKLTGEEAVSLMGSIYTFYTTTNFVEADNEIANAFAILRKMALMKYNELAEDKVNSFRDLRIELHDARVRAQGGM